MRSNKYTDEQLQFIKEHRSMFRKDLAVAFNKRFGTAKTECAIKTVCSRYRWNTGRPKGLPKGLAPRTYTKEQIQFLSDNRSMPRRKLVEAFNAGFNENKSLKAIASLCKKEGFETGRDGRFKKGDLPFNTGTKGLVKPNSGSFQKGHDRVERKPIGAERIDVKDGYIIVKTADPNIWRHKHKVVWEKAYGPIEAGEVITFLDGDLLNVSLDNLVKITRKELLWLNQNNYKNTPAELRPTLLALAKLNVKIFKLKNKNRGKP